MRNFLGVVCLVSLMSVSTARAQGPVRIVAAVGQTPTGAPGAIETLSQPCIDGLGHAGFTGTAGGVTFVWVNDGIVWLNTDEPTSTLLGGLSTCGIGDGGKFIYNPNVDGNEAVWTDTGLLLAETSQAPGLAMGVTNTLNRRPLMTPSGAVYWVAAYNLTGGASHDGRVLYTSPDGTLANTEIVMQSGDVFGGLAIASNGIDFDYFVSDNGLHSIHVVRLDTGSSLDDDAIITDGTLVALELQPNGDGDNWDNFDLVAINNNGNYLLSGDTDGPIEFDEFLAYNGAIVVREGDTIDGHRLAFAVLGLALNNYDQAVFAWQTTGPDETLFAACDASNPSAATAVLTTNDDVDVNGDGVADATVTDLDLNSALPGLRLTDAGKVFIRLQVMFYGGPTTQVIAELDTGCAFNLCGNGNTDPGETCDDGNNTNGDGCSADCLSDETCGNGVVDIGEACDDGNTSDGDGCSADCATLEYCGNGVVDVGETCDDGNNANGDGCSAGCTSDETCGNGVLDIGEACDDGNTTDGDGCSAVCADESAGDADEGGCGCATSGNSGAPVTALLLLFAGLIALRRREGDRWCGGDGL